ncbi:MAG: TrfB-related DNA-binding protein [Kribbellaceae bacterium]
MSAYSATVVRESRWWVITVAGIGVTQARRLSEVEAQAAGLVEATTGDANAVITADVRLPAGTRREVAEARRLTAAAAQAQLDAAERTRAAVRHLLESGMSQADVATILGVSRQRVTQLAGRSREARLAS